MNTQKVYRFHSSHPTGGRCLVKISESKILKHMKNKAEGSDSELLKMFIEEYNAELDFKETESSQHRLISKTEIINSEHFIYARSEGTSARNAYDNCKLNKDISFNFVRDSKKYTTVCILEDAYKYIDTDDEVLNLLRTLKLYKVNKKSVYSVYIGNSEYIFFKPLS